MHNSAHFKEKQYVHFVLLDSNSSVITRVVSMCQCELIRTALARCHQTGWESNRSHRGRCGRDYVCEGSELVWSGSGLGWG